jgi:hypothetical protein
MAEPATRFPLAWPLGWARTPAGRRQRAAFRKSTTTMVATGPVGQTRRETRDRPLTVAEALTRLAGELARLGATHELLSTNIPIRLDGLPRSGLAEPADPGVAAYFRLKGQPRCLACDRWDRTADNIAAVAQHIDALRRIDRYGVGTLDQVFAGYAALAPAAEADWWYVLGIRPTATLVEVEEAYRRLAKERHPDAGGGEQAMAMLNVARDAARRALGAG